MTTAHGKAFSLEGIYGNVLHEEPVGIVGLVVKNQLPTLTDMNYQIPQTLVYFNRASTSSTKLQFVLRRIVMFLASSSPFSPTIPQI